MKSKFTLLFSLLIIGTTQAQEVPRKLIVEHFTNTLCGTCAARNPGFFNNYDSQNQGNMIHLSIYPSAPYSACILNKHDTQANDERTKFYGIYGATPRLVVNGEVVSFSTSFNSPALFTPYVGLTTPVSVNLTQQKFGTDSMRVRVVIRTEATHSLAAQNLYVVLAEDTIFYNAPNGESEHYDVFRRALTGNTGMSVTIPTTIGDSLVITRTTSVHADWDFSRIFALAILQDDQSKVVTQSNALSPNSNTTVVLGVKPVAVNNAFKVFPNPVINSVNIKSITSGKTTFKVISITGEQVMNGQFIDNTNLDLSGVTEGIYLLVLENKNETYTHKLVKTRK